MNLQPILESELLILKPLSEEHDDALYRVAKDPLIWEQHQFKDRYKRDIYDKLIIDSLQSKGAFVVIEKSSTEIIGSTRFKKLSNVDSAVEIGWSFLSRDKWGRGYNKSIKKLMIDYAFDYVEDVIFYVDKDNLRSQKAVQKIGGVRIVESHLKHFLKDNDTDWTYRINKQDWRRMNSQS